MTEPVGSPLWWLEQLSKRLDARQSTIARYEAYYEGEHPLMFVTAKWRETFAKMLASLNDNWMALVVDAVEERLHLDGFRMGDNPAADKDAWLIWQRNYLDSDSELAHTAALTSGSCPVMVWADTDGEPQITVEHPAQVAVAYVPGSRRRRAAAVKLWRDEWTGDTFGNVYLPDGIYKFLGDADSQEISPIPGGGQIVTRTPRWRERETVANPLAVVPVLELVNRPRLLANGRSEIEQVTSTQDQINKLLCDMMIASEFGSFRQRWATGIEMPTDPDTGEELEPFKAAIDRLWHVPAPDAKFGEFGQTDLGVYVKAIENRVQSLASRTRTPPHYLLGQSGSFPSGESLKATETGLIAKAKSKQRHFGETWEDVVRLAFKVKNDPRADEATAEAIWSDPESRTEAEHVDALVKKLSLKIPLQQLWEDAGYTSTQISRFRQMLLEQAFDAMLTAPAPAAAPTPAPAAAGA